MKRSVRGPDTPVWAASPIDENYDSILSQLEQSAPVRLITTFGTGLVSAFLNEPASEASTRADTNRYDFLPVRDGDNGAIVGLFSHRKSSYLEGQTVQQVMEPLTGANLISADAPLLEFVRNADRAQCRLVLEKTDVTGIVTLSDVQRLPVRTVLFGLFIHLEILLTEALRRALGSEEVAYGLLSHDRRQKATDLWCRSRGQGLERDGFSVLQFADKRTIAQKTEFFRKNCNLSRSKIEKELSTIENDLRNPIAHGSIYAQTLSEALALISATNLVLSWITLIKRHLEIAGSSH